jgi:hypothetical protein
MTAYSSVVPAKGEEGNWNGSVMVGGSHGNSGTLTWTAYTEGLDEGSNGNS